MYKVMISLCILTLLSVSLSAQTQKEIDKKTIEVMEGRENPKSADSASQKHFENIIRNCNIEYKENNDYAFFPIGKRINTFINNKSSNVSIDLVKYHLISRDSSEILGIHYFDLKNNNDIMIKGSRNYGDPNEDLFNSISGITYMTGKKITVTERKNEPNYQYYNADRIGDFQILSNEPLYYLNYRYLTSYYILKKDVGYFRIYKFVKDDHVHKDDDMDIPKLFKFK